MLSFSVGSFSGSKPMLSHYFFSFASGVLGGGGGGDRGEGERGNGLQFRMDNQSVRQSVYIMDFHFPLHLPSLPRLSFPPGVQLTSLPRAQKLTYRYKGVYHRELTASWRRR
ncbi:hypothetical protein CHARACLAT_004201 [Characodon lateralis]|uniref:Uncharacterized protein n=1 Tax=Characodon lateralis TaxID=208331 RepID=A0ABU7DRD3_9TELE|nr:hypothetical protein [Characodon lateralis]